jgi:hypothetical protein
MRTRGGWLVYLALCLGLWGCGATVGDPCTTAADCGNALCINREHTPGGYCSRQCTSDTDCPSGTTCVQDGAANGVNACFRVCAAEQDCRRGYVCTAARVSGRQICVGPSGF